MNALLEKLRTLNIKLEVVDDQLKLNAPKGVVTKELLGEIKDCKEELIKYISRVIQKEGFESIPRVTEKSFYKLSSAQKRLYFLYEFDKTSTAYNMLQVVKLEGQIDVNKFETAFNQLLKRHESLRTSFVIIDGEPFQKIAEHLDFKIEYFHLENKENSVESIFKEFIRPFNLNEGPLVRIGLIESNPKEYILMVDMHHIICDGVSQEILMRDFMSLYSNQELPDLELKYKDYAEWQQSEEQQKKRSLQKDFWLEKYSDEVTTLELPTDFPRPKDMSSNGSSVNFKLDKTATAGLKAIAEKENSTLFMTIFAVFNILMSKLSNQDDIVVGIPTAGRSHHDLEQMIGMFVNTVPLRNYPKGFYQFNEFLSKLTTSSLACFDKQTYQYEELIDDLKVRRDTSRNPLFDVMFSFENIENTEFTLPNLNIKPYKFNGIAALIDLNLEAIEIDHEIICSFEYVTDIFKRETVERFAAYFMRTVDAILSQPKIHLSEIEILDSEEENQLLVEFNQTEQLEYSENESFVDLFESNVKEYPDRIAVKHEQESWSYSSLNELSNRIAHYLRSEKIEKGQVIPLLMDRGVSLLACIIGIQKAGGAFVAIDMRNPPDRIEKIINDCSPNLAIIESRHLAMNLNTGDSKLFVADSTSSLTEQFKSFPNHNLDQLIDPEDLAYVVFTSGSTGKPKGVMLHHGGMVNHFLGLGNFLSFTKSDCFAQSAECSFDVYVVQFLLSLVFGGCTHIIDREQLLEPDHLKDLLTKNPISTIELVPSIIKSLLNSESAAPIKLRWLISTGEAISSDLVKEWYDIYPNIPIVNAYGPAEVSDDATAYIIPAKSNDKNNSVIPIGKALPNYQLYVLNESLKLCPIGVKGELCISGRGVGKGYWKDKVSTKEKFIDNPFAESVGKRQHKILYKTGDIGYWLPDGNLVCLGRLDDMVKIRGARIEIGEIEKSIRSIDEIQEVVVLAKGVDDHKILVAYYVTYSTLRQEHLRNYLSEKLPNFMIPTFFVEMEEMPKTLNGKLNKKALPEPELNARNEYVTPETEEEQLLAEVWSRVLGVEQIGSTDNFFSVGGDSIKSIQISSRIRSKGYIVTVKDIISCQTIKRLALRLEKTNRTSDQSIITGQFGLTPIQKWFFENYSKDRNHYNQSVMMNFREGLSSETVERIFQKIQEHHDALRMVFQMQDGSMIQENRGPDHPLVLEEIDLTNHNDSKAALLTACEKMQASIQLEIGPLMKLGLYHMTDGTRLIIVIHHLVIDGVSWRILFEDIETLYQQIEQGESLSLPLKTDSFVSWNSHLMDYCKSRRFNLAKSYWQSILSKKRTIIPKDYPNGSKAVKHSANLSFRLNKENTSNLLTKVHAAFNTQINDLLLAALVLVIKKTNGNETIMVELEGHGRDQINQANINRTIGWFTSFYPIYLGAKSNDLSLIIKEVKENLRRVPNNGIDYLLLRYLANEDKTIADFSTNQSPQIGFNYLGQFDTDTEDNSFGIAEESKGNDISPDADLEYEWEFSGIISRGQLEIGIVYSNVQYNKERIQTLMNSYKECLKEIIDYCASYHKKELTPSDMTFKGLSINQLDNLRERYDLENIYTLSTMQEGMLFHALLDSDSENYSEQMTFRWEGALDLAAVEKSMNDLIARYDILRTLFISEEFTRPLQLVLNRRVINLTFSDIRKSTSGLLDNDLIEKYRLADKAQKFDLSKDVLMRLVVLQIADDKFEFIWSHHHIIMDGWCMGIIIQDFEKLYLSNKMRLPCSLPDVIPYSRYIEWLEERESEEAKAYWKNYLKGYTSLTSLPYKENVVKGGSPQKREYDFVLLKEQDTSLLLETSRKYSVTINTIIQMAWAILLSKHKNANDIIFGNVLSGRPTMIEGIETMIGLFINTVPFRVQFDKNERIKDLLKQLQISALESEQYSYISLSEVQAVSELENELFDNIITFENFPIEELIESSDSNKSTKEYKVTNVRTFDTNNFNLTLSIFCDKEIHANFTYDWNNYDKKMMAKYGKQWSYIIHQIINDGGQKKISEIELISKQERQSIFNELDNYSKNNLLTPKLKPASYHQERLCFFDKKEPGDLSELAPTYHNIPLVIDFEGVDHACLEKSLQLLFLKHEILRTRMVNVDEQTFQKIIEYSPLNLKKVEVGVENIDELVKKEINKAFVLDQFLVRSNLFTIDKTKSRLLLVFHHIIVDRYSINLLTEALLDNYKFYLKGESIPSSKEDLTYAGFAQWQKESLIQLEPYLLGYWKEKLGGKLKTLELPTDGPKIGIPSYTAGSKNVLLTKKLVDKIEQFSEENSIDSKVVLMTAFKILLFKYARHEEILIGTSLENRQVDRLKNTIGPIANLIVIRSFISTNINFIEYLKTMDAIYRSCENYQSMPFDKLVKELALEKDISRNALFDVLFQFDDKTIKLPENLVGKVSITETNLGYGNYDLNLFLQKIDQKIKGILVFNLDHFNSFFIESLITHYIVLLENLLAKPETQLGEINMLSAIESDQLLHGFNSTEAPHSEEDTIVSLFVEQSCKTPEAIALNFEGTQLTFKELDALTNQLAYQLKDKHQIRHGDLVGLQLDRTNWMVVSILGILKSGAAYVPIDPKYPTVRKKYIATDSNIKLLISEMQYLFDIEYYKGTVFAIDTEFEPGAYTVAPPSDLPSSDSLAYIIYTSGSTGLPKGVMINQNSLVNYINSSVENYIGTEEASFGLYSSISFDLTVTSIFTPLISGNTLFIYQESKNHLLIEKVIMEDCCSVVKLTPSHLKVINDSKNIDASSITRLKIFIVGGEELESKLAKSIFEKFEGRVDIYNEYGPTEATVGCMIYKYEPTENSKSVPIGNPINNTQLYLLDDSLMPVPFGVRGELFISGNGLALGYINNEELTRERFIDNPFIDNQKMYKTGDLAIRRPDGNIIFKGRVDDQVKIRGYRIELREIEHHLTAFESISESVVVVKEKESEKQLIAYYLAEGKPLVTAIREDLLRKLPEYMIPTYFLQLDEMPLTSNGKLNRNALPDPEIKQEVDHIFPENKIEEKLVTIWSELLKVKKELVSTNRSFFEMGGHSLIAIRLINAIQQAFNKTVKLKEVFENPTIRQQALHIKKIASEKVNKITRIKAQNFYPVSSAQERLFYEQLLNKDNIAYNVSGIYQIKGKLHIDKLTKTFNLLIERHESLRTKFVITDKGLVQRIIKQIEIELEVIKPEKHQGINKIFDGFIRPFNLSEDLLLRCGLYKDHESNHYLFVDMHHIICDGISLNILMNDFKKLYMGEKLAPLTLRYIDYAAWQHNDKNSMDTQKAFWVNQLSGNMHSLDLPVIQNRDTVETNHAFNKTLYITGELYQEIEQFILKNNVSEYMFLLSIYYVLLNKMSGNSDIIVGTDVIGRTHDNLENVVGTFVNVLPLRLKVIDENTYLVFLKNLKFCVLECFDRQDFQYDQMVSTMKEYGHEGNDLFNVHFSFANVFDSKVELEEVKFEPIEIQSKETAPYELMLEVTKSKSEIQIDFLANKELYEEETIELFTNYYRHILSFVLQNEEMLIENIELENTVSY